MNYFKIDGRQYRAEIRRTKTDVGMVFDATVEVRRPRGGWFVEVFEVSRTRPAARRALKREIERLATGPDGKRANWTIARSDRRAAWDRVIAATARTTEAFGGLALAAVGAGRAMAALHEPLHKFAEVAR